MKVSLITDSEEYGSRMTYILDFINNHPLNTGLFHFQTGSNPGAINLYYSNQVKEGPFLTPRQGVLFSGNNTIAYQLVANQYRYSGGFIYSVEQYKKESGNFYCNGVFGFDWIETIFFHISRYEEFYCPDSKKDQWDMMLEENQFLVIHGIHQIPVVDKLVQAILSVLGSEKLPPLTKITWTHDLDAIVKYKSPFRVFRAIIRNLLDRKSMISCFRILNRYLRIIFGKGKDPFLNFNWLLIDSPHQAVVDQKILFIMTGGTSPYDNYYRIGDHRLTEILSMAKTRGYQIGLHGSYNSFDNQKMFQEEISTLETLTRRPVHFNRQHFLHYSFQHTGCIFEGSGIKTDSSLGYQRKTGFRCGTGFTYSLYNFKEERAYRFKELPMVVMDGGLLEESDGDIGEATQKILGFCEANRLGTHITFNFHNSIFDPDKRDVSEMKTLYYNILRFFNFSKPDC